MNTIGRDSASAAAATAFETDEDKFYEDEDPGISGVNAASASIFYKRVDKKAASDAEFLKAMMHILKDRGNKKRKILWFKW